MRVCMLFLKIYVTFVRRAQITDQSEMTISYEVRKAVVLLKHSSFFDKIFEKRYCTKNFLIV